MGRTWMITGVSSGFGYEMTRQLLEKGDTVIGTVRNTKKVESLIAEYLETFDCQIPDATGADFRAIIAGRAGPQGNSPQRLLCLRNRFALRFRQSGKVPHGGQMLICVGGRGYYQEWGKEAVEMTPGTVINIPEGVKHWHGAAPDSWLSHLAVEVPGENGRTEWLEPVSGEDYGKLR